MDACYMYEESAKVYTEKSEALPFPWNQRFSVTFSLFCWWPATSLAVQKFVSVKMFNAPHTCPLQENKLFQGQGNVGSHISRSESTFPAKGRGGIQKPIGIWIPFT